jgi:SNF2 family DNA or RNA helicase
MRPPPFSQNNDLEIRLIVPDFALLQPGAPFVFVSPDLYRLRLQAEHAVLVAGFDELICLDSLDFTPFDYQVRAAQIMLRRFRGRGMFCDEVGLGKTIEAGLVLKEYLLRNVAQRVLVLTPAALVEQWREELAVKFSLADFASNTDPEFRARGPAAWEYYPRVVASFATARRAEHRAQISQIPYDLVIVDEAHHLKNRASLSWKFVNGLQRKYLLLLTATPVENNLDELYNLITLLKPGQLKTPREFRKQFVSRGDPRLPKNRGRLRELLGDVMVRHTRAQVNIKLPSRQAHTLRLAFSPDEAAFYEAVSNVVRSSLAPQPSTAIAPGEPQGTRVKSADRFALLTLQREIGSSSAAAISTLRTIAERQADRRQRDHLLSLAEQAMLISTWAKAEALEKLLVTLFEADAGEKVLLFTHFRRTLDLLTERLEKLGVSYVVYHGGMSIADKNQAIADFEASTQVLLSTEAAGEGRNLQFCRTMINFDIPWNPMRIEQRVGRIHRVGQSHPVRIYNLSVRNTVEDYLLDLLDQKLNMFELVIGEMDMILGHLSDERDFEELLLDVWVNAQSQSDLQDGFDRLGNTLLKARQSYQRSNEYDEALFGQDFSTE